MHGTWLNVQSLCINNTVIVIISHSIDTIDWESLTLKKEKKI